jgi:hypothetical protein
MKATHLAVAAQSSLTTPALEGIEPVREAVIHELKCWPEFFSEISAGRKRHDLRRCDDRHFHVGDRLRLREFDPKAERYTGRCLVVCVTYITSADVPCALSNAALDRNFCILSIEPIT